MILCSFSTSVPSRLTFRVLTLVDDLILIQVAAHNTFMHVLNLLKVTLVGIILSTRNVKYCILTFTLDLNNSIVLQKGPSEAAQSSQEGRLVPGSEGFDLTLAGKLPSISLCCGLHDPELLQVFWGRGR